MLSKEQPSERKLHFDTIDQHLNFLSLTAKRGSRRGDLTFILCFRNPRGVPSVEYCTNTILTVLTYCTGKYCPRLIYRPSVRGQYLSINPKQNPKLDILLAVKWLKRLSFVTFEFDNTQMN